MRLQQLTTRSIIKGLFFGNYFYGLCVVALSMEACLQQLHPLNSISYYVLTFIATVLYYTKAYIPSKAVDSENPRTRWYARNKKEILLSQWLLTIAFLLLAALYLYKNFDGFLKMPLLNWGLLIIFPLLAILYYGIDQRFFGNYSLRSIGWLKPFVIGMIWAAIATVYPIIFNGVEHAAGYYELNLVGAFLFIKNFMYITVLCIMFDIKDYATDSNHQIKTFVVNVGLRKTIFYIILPLSAIGLASFLGYAIDRHFSSMKIFMNLIPFVLLLIVAYSMHRRQSIFYYLAIIDGLMLVKGICGGIAMSFF
jgi:4-hydroxybenzoate polyprenyltransferase